MSTYLIAGGSRGIGFRVVERLAAHDHRLLVYSRTPGELALSDTIQHVPCDFATELLPTESLPEALEGLVYCPGSINLRSFRALKPHDYESDFRLNVLGAVRLIQAALPKLKKAAETNQQPASIVLYSTVAVALGLPMHASVAASKGALEALARTLAIELAPHVRVNCIAPALVATELSARFLDTPEKSAAMAAKYPLGRVGTADDIAAMTEFLVSPQSSWLTGQVIGVDGGMSRLSKP